MRRCVGSFLQKRARLNPHQTGVVFRGERISFRDWSNRANQAGRALAGLGVLPGDRVGLLLTNSPQFLECFFGLARIGAIAVPMNTRLTQAEISHHVRDAGIRVLVHGFEFRQTVEKLDPDLTVEHLVVVGGDRDSRPGYEDLLRAQPETTPEAAGGGDAPAVIYYTSGTTGRPKGAVLSHDNLFYGALTISNGLDWRAGDRALVAMPLFHIGALIVSLINVYLGTTTVLMESFDPDEFLGNVEKYEINSFVGAVTMLHMMAESAAFPGRDLSSLRWVLSGPTPQPVFMKWAGKEVIIQQVYGLTETAGGAALLPAERAADKPGSTGLPMFHTDIRVVDEQGDDLGPGETGEILIRGPHVAKEYWNNPTATAEAFRNGWLASGDLGRLDEEGFLYIVGRKKDMIRSGEENIYPAEVESVLAEMPQVSEIAVIGRPDPVWGEKVCAVARLHPGAELTLAAVEKHLSGRIARYKMPKELVLHDQPLPRGPAGRVRKEELLRMLWN